MSAKDLILNIAVNLGRLGRWAMEKKPKRMKIFLLETEGFLEQLEKAPKSDRFQKTFDLFSKKFVLLKNDVQLDDDWAEQMLTWANILSHRAKLA